MATATRNGVSERLSKHLRKKARFCVRQACPKGGGNLWGGVPPQCFLTLEPRMTFSSRRNAFPAKLGETPPVRIVTFSDSCWGKSLLSDSPGPSGIPAENFRRDRGTVAKKLTPCVPEARWRIYEIHVHRKDFDCYEQIFIIGSRLGTRDSDIFGKQTIRKV